MGSSILWNGMVFLISLMYAMYDEGGLVRFVSLLVGRVSVLVILCA